MGKMVEKVKSKMRILAAAAGEAAAAAEYAEAAAKAREVDMDRLSTGIGSLTGINPELRERAVKNIEEWLLQAIFNIYVPQLCDLIEKEKWDFLLDSFYQTIPFGTGGRRGPVGLGTNRINPYTIATSVMGHIKYLRERYPGNDDLKVVVAYDVRVFNDSIGRYDPKIHNPLLGLTSNDFARVAAQVYAGGGVKVYILPEDSGDYISTPELSFLIRKLGAHGGLNISASHNHPDDNGGKFYNVYGGQEIPPDDERMAQMVEDIREVRLVDYRDAVTQELIVPIDSGLRRAYVDLILGLSLTPVARSARVAFTPLHGTGKTTVGVVLREAGFPIEIEPTQASFDGNFPNVPYRIPNPEVPESMERAKAFADEINADLVLSTDPDADRLGAMVPKRNGEWVFLTGNEIAALVTHYILETRRKNGTLPEQPFLIKTEVTSELTPTMGRQYNARSVDNLLVGFKYIGEVIRSIEETGRFGDLEADYADFLLGVEESHGLLVTPDMRDKDAAGGALMLAELVSVLKAEGRTAYGCLLDLYRKHGCHANVLVPMIMRGAQGMTRIVAIQDAFRKDPPKEIGGIPVTRFVDHWDEAGIFGPIKSETDRASRNVLVFRLENGARVTLRPSGTEPKNKIYVEVKSDPAPGASDTEIEERMAGCMEEARKLGDDLTLKGLAVIGKTLSDYGLRISGLVALDDKLDFAERFLPELEEKAERVLANDLSIEEASQWVEKRLASYGKDPRGLVREAFKLYTEGVASAARRQEGRVHLKNVLMQEKIFGAP